MKDDIHPRLQDAVIACACGNTFNTRSTKGSYKVDVCGACHPVFTGRQGSLVVDRLGRLERFKRKYGSRGGAQGESSSAS